MKPATANGPLTGLLNNHNFQSSRVRAPPKFAIF